MDELLRFSLAHYAIYLVLFMFYGFIGYNFADWLGFEERAEIIAVGSGIVLSIASVVYWRKVSKN